MGYELTVVVVEPTDVSRTEDGRTFGLEKARFELGKCGCVGFVFKEEAKYYIYDQGEILDIDSYGDKPRQCKIQEFIVALEEMARCEKIGWWKTVTKCMKEIAKYNPNYLIIGFGN